MSGTSSNQQGYSDAERVGPWQERLQQHCAANGLRPPIYSIASDRRGQLCFLQSTSSSCLFVPVRVVWEGCLRKRSLCSESALIAGQSAERERLAPTSNLPGNLETGYRLSLISLAKGRLENKCNACHAWLPPFQSMLTALLGGRTAWSCSVDVQGTTYNARYW